MDFLLDCCFSEVEIEKKGACKKIQQAAGWSSSNDDCFFG